MMKPKSRKENLDYSIISEMPTASPTPIIIALNLPFMTGFLL